MTRIWRLRAALTMAGALVVSAPNGAPPAAASTGRGGDWPRARFHRYDAHHTRDAPTAAYRDLGYRQTRGPRSAGAD